MEYRSFVHYKGIQTDSANIAPGYPMSRTHDNNRNTAIPVRSPEPPVLDSLLAVCPQMTGELKSSELIIPNSGTPITLHLHPVRGWNRTPKGYKKVQKWTELYRHPYYLHGNWPSRRPRWHRCLGRLEPRTLVGRFFAAPDALPGILSHWKQRAQTGSAGMYRGPLPPAPMGESSAGTA
jgi:hypothetical protein